jgi:2-polyprenyl-6-methoxyphenol hydroxylase-like FAD-dependent oxidoreductase
MNNNLTVAIIGGSVGGLFAAITLADKGYDVRVYERSSGEMHSRGAGLGIQSDMMQYLVERGILTEAESGVVAKARQSLGRDDEIIFSSDHSLPSTSWDLLWRRLRAAVPDYRYFAGFELVDVRNEPDAAVATFANGIEVRADLIVGADGTRSIVREAIAPNIQPEYAGYVVLRGMADESLLSGRENELFAENFSMFSYPHSHIVLYFVPGANGELNAGHRRYNWVWYVNMDAAELEATLTDRNGRSRDFAVPAGHFSLESIASLHSRAAADLPPALAAAVTKTPVPFVQAITDMVVPRMHSGRLAIIGDAAFIVRPHTAAGTAKAFRDAFSLAHYLREAPSIENGLELWEQRQIGQARRLVSYGSSIALDSGLGPIQPGSHPRAA